MVRVSTGGHGRVWGEEEEGQGPNPESQHLRSERESLPGRPTEETQARWCRGKHEGRGEAGAEHGACFQAVPEAGTVHLEATPD